MMRSLKTAGIAVLLLAGSATGGWIAGQANSSNQDSAAGSPSLDSPRTVHATAKRGTVRSVIVLEGSVAEDDSARKVGISKSRTISASIRPEQLVRFSTLPKSGKAKVDGGPAAQNCTLSTLKPGDTPESPAQMECTFDEPVGYPGVRAELALTAGEVRDVVTLPLSAVDGTSQTGVVYVVENGKSRPESVKLGLNDGVNVEITSGIVEGATVLDPPPSLFSTAGQS